MTLQKKNTTEILHKLDYDEDDQNNVVLIAIKSNMPDYKIAYHLNKTLHLRLEKVVQEISLITENGVNYFRHFFYEDCNRHLVWRLIENKSNTSISLLENAGSLFQSSEDLFAATEFLIPEWKTIDFFICIENADFFFDEEALVQQLDEIKNISTHFAVDVESLSIKSKKNLIF